MDFWTAAVIVVALWSVVTIWTRRHDRELGVARDEDGNPVFPPSAQGKAEDPQARAEIQRLRERIVVLERIVTDRGHALADEIERLRDERSVEDAPLPGLAEKSAARSGAEDREPAR
ncbi:MAG: hypothetical protein RIC51_12090 [Erythrobacter sp.]|uniref:hypothetical protein n=1 Tax=Erythrobacter sp. TaxID=1042 RepID=UPI0032EC9B0B